jgi:hypothetical protein
MGKMLDKFKKKDKLANKSGTTGEKGAEPEELEPRRHLPPVYLTCADVRASFSPLSFFLLNLTPTLHAHRICPRT